MKKFVSLLTAVMFLVSPFMTMSLMAQEPVLLVTPKAYYFMYVIDDVPQAPTEVKSVIVINGTPDNPNPPTNPDDPNDPTNPPNPKDTVSEEIGKVASPLNDPKSAKALALLYQQAASSIRDGKLLPEKAPQFISYGTTLILAQTGGTPTAWEAVSKKVEDLVRLGRQAGTLSSNADWVKFYESVAGGLNATTAGHQFDELTLDEILQFILKILPILLTLFGV